MNATTIPADATNYAISEIDEYREAARKHLAENVTVGIKPEKVTLITGTGYAVNNGMFWEGMTLGQTYRALLAGHPVAQIVEHPDFTDGALAGVIAKGDAVGPGPRRAAQHLLKILPTREGVDITAARSRAQYEAYTLQNLIGGRYSDMVADAARAVSRLLDAGTYAEELYGERTARQARELDQERRALRAKTDILIFKASK